MIDITVLLKKKKRLEKLMTKKVNVYFGLRAEIMDLRAYIAEIDYQIAMGVSSKDKKGKQL